MYPLQLTEQFSHIFLLECDFLFRVVVVWIGDAHQQCKLRVSLIMIVIGLLAHALIPSINVFIYVWLLSTGSDDYATFIFMVILEFMSC